MSQFLKGKIAVVTGGSRGIGRAIVEALLAEGANVALCGRSQASVDETVAALGESGRILGRSVDVRNPQQVAAFFSELENTLGGPDILVNNAGLGIFAPVSDLTVENWNEVLATNLHGVFYCSREAVARMKGRGGGTIVNISSLAGKNAFAGGSAYNASKFGLTGLSESMMLDHRRDHIRVCYVMPGSVDTEFGGHGTGAEWKIAAADIAEAVLLVLRMPARTTISRIEMRPSIPPG
jgi:NAD(P)-dependent dehydrogenase (short-subunit alcohol dehydrogenase family)